MDYDKILSQVRDEFDRWDQYVRQKREVFRKDLKRYYNEKKNKDKVWDTTMYNIHSSLLARLYVNAPQIFFATDEIWHREIVDNLNMTFKEDYESQDMEVLKYQVQWDMLFYWVGITAKTGWDWLEKKNTFQVVDPRTVIPDPDWDYSNGEYNYIGFLKKVYLTDLEAQWYDIEEINPLTNRSEWPEHVKRTDQEMSWLAPNTQFTWDSNDTAEIYYHFTCIDGVKYMIVTANQNTLVLDVKELPAIHDYEKKDKTKIKFPFAFKYFKPVRNNFYWYRVADLIRDVQDTKALIANLRLDKSKAELYPMYLYNTRLVKNKTDLDFGFNKLIPVNPLEWESVQNAIQPLSKDFRADNSYLVDDSLDKQVQDSTSIGGLQKWSTTERRETATTNRIQQDNADINLWLIEKTSSWGDKQFAEIWFRWYLENFKDWDKKSVRFYNGFGILPKKLIRKDFLAIHSVKIYVETNTDKLEKLNKQRIAFSQVFPLLQTLQVPKTSMNFAFRQILIANWLDSQQVDIIVPKTPQELIAEQNVELLRMWEFVPVEDSYDPLTHLIILKTAPNTPNVEIYRSWLLELYKIQWGDEKQMEQVSESVQNNVSAQAMNQLGNLWQQI